MENYFKRVGKGSVTIFLCIVLSGIFGYFLRMYLTRTVSVAEYGLFFAVFSLIAFLVSIIGLGLYSSLTKYLSEFIVTNELKKIKYSLKFVFLAQLAITMIFMLVIFFISHDIAIYFFKSQAAEPILNILLVFLLVYTWMFFFRHAFQGMRRMLELGFTFILYSGLALLFLIALFSFSSSMITNIAYAYVLGTAATVIVCFIFFLKDLRQLGKIPSLSKKEKAVVRKSLIMFGIPVIFIGIANSILSNIDTLIITYFRSTYEVGIYQTALPTAQILLYFSSAMTTILFPIITELWTKKKYQFISTNLSLLTKLTFLLIIPAAMLFIAFPENVINILFGADYISGAFALQLLTISIVVFSIGMLFTITLNGMNKPGLNAKIIGIAAVLNIIINIFLVPILGIIGAAITAIITFGLYFLLSSACVIREFKKKNISFTVPYKELAKIFAGVYISLTIIFITKIMLVSHPLIELAAALMLGVGFYIFWVFYAKCITKNDIKTIKKTSLPIPAFILDTLERFAKN